jgi:protein SCO1/2
MCDPLSCAWRSFRLGLGAGGALLLAGCGNPSTPPANAPGPTNHAVALAVTNDGPVLPGMQASPLESTNVLRAFVARGVIRVMPEGGKSLVIKHEDIPGFMPKMTMEFDVRDPGQLKGLAVGDPIVFEIKADQNESWIEGIHRAGTNDLAAVAPADPASVALLHANQLKPGEELPDAELLSEEGRAVRFSDFRGKAVAFTFIFTRCPLPDYCPRMSKNFSRTRELLVQRNDAPSNWQFLSISFDPGFDQPGVLSRYAYSYRGGLTNQWLFAAAPTKVLKALASQIDFRLGNEEGSFQHNLRTVVLDTQGRVFQNFEGNQWKAEDLAEAMIQAARK